jgi:hypothetical protein
MVAIKPLKIRNIAKSLPRLLAIAVAFLKFLVTAHTKDLNTLPPSKGYAGIRLIAPRKILIKERYANIATMGFWAPSGSLSERKQAIALNKKYSTKLHIGPAIAISNSTLALCGSFVSCATPPNTNNFMPLILRPL